jgi:hypothetical protein
MFCSMWSFCTYQKLEMNPTEQSNRNFVQNTQIQECCIQRDRIIKTALRLEGTNHLKHASAWITNWLTEKISVDPAAVEQKAWKLLKLCNMAPKILTNAQEIIQWVLRLKKHTQIKKAQLYVSTKCAIHPQNKSHNAEALFLPPSKPWNTEGI